MEDNKTFYNLQLNFRRKSKQLTYSIDTLTDLIEKKTNMKDFIKSALDGNVQEEFRPILWKLFLHILPVDGVDTWEELMKYKRDEYTKKCEQLKVDDFLIYIENYKKVDESGVINSEINSDYQKSYKILTNLYSTQFFESLNIIRLDVDRTFQEIDLFRNSEIKGCLAKILYIWSVENDDVGYCQGMNEILGTLCYALYPSNTLQASLMHPQAHENSKYKKYFSLLNSEEHFEADLYKIFSEMMSRGFKELFNYNDVKYRMNYKNGLVDGFELLDKNLLTLDDIRNSNYSKLKKRINKIFFLYLRIYDKQLFTHLSDKVEPYLFLFRWILCLLNREISLKYIIGVWDCIFAIEYADYPKTVYQDINDYEFKNNNFKENFNFLDYLCVAMICDLKEDIMKEDDTCYLLSSLMHFPNEHNLKSIIKNALLIRDKLHDHFRVADEFVIVD